MAPAKVLHEKLSEAKRQDRLTYEKAFKAYVDSAATGGRHGADLTLFGLLKDLKAKADISEKEVFAEGLKRHQVGVSAMSRTRSTCLLNIIWHVVMNQPSSSPFQCVPSGTPGICQ